jgi:hypothetical protein
VVQEESVRVHENRLRVIEGGNLRSTSPTQFHSQECHLRLLNGESVELDEQNPGGQFLNPGGQSQKILNKSLNNIKNTRGTNSLRSIKDTNDSNNLKSTKDIKEINHSLEEGKNPGGQFSDPLKEKPRMTKKIGPLTRLKLKAEEVLSSGKLKRSENPPRRKDTRHEKFREKSPSEYNVNDIEIIFKKAWAGSELTGKPFRWTMKDRGQVRDLLNDQGGEAVKIYFEYIIQNWESIRSRYNMGGSPSVALLYGYRRSWFSEALEGGPPKVKKPGMVEYEEHDFDGGETGWGY